MRAIINGLVIEGTVNEVIEYQNALEVKAKQEAINKFNNQITYVFNADVTGVDGLADVIAKSFKNASTTMQ